MIPTRCGSVISCKSRLLIGILPTILLICFPTSCKFISTAEKEAVLVQQRLELVFTYSSEKEKWIKEVTDAFNRDHHLTSTGKQIFVRAIPMGSGDAIAEVMEGCRQPHIISPASAAFISVGNAQSRRKYGHDLIASTQNLVRSPVVIAMWKPMAEALGWGKKPIGWADILALARNRKGRGAYAYPQWERFKFGHASPLYSNSGLISLFAEAYAASGRTAGLTVGDVNKTRTAAFLSSIEKSVVHGGPSTGSLAHQMFFLGPQYLSAAVLYENMVIESYG